MTGPADPAGLVVAIRSIRAADADRLADLLDAEERRKADRYRLPDDRARFVLGRGLLREMVGAAIGRSPSSLRFSPSPHGKPTLADAPGLAFNVAHSGDLVLVATARATLIGVDVERHRADLDLAAAGRLVLTPSEQAAVAAAGPGGRIAAFFRHWVMKEAVVKALGTGLSLEPRRFEVRFAPAGPEVAFVADGPDDVGSGWRLSEPAVPAGYSAALALRA